MSRKTIDKFGRQKNQRLKSLRGSPGIGFKLTDLGHYDIQNKFLHNVALPKKPGDATNQKYILDLIEQIRIEFVTAVQKYSTDQIAQLRKEFAAVKDVTARQKYITEQIAQLRKELREVVKKNFTDEKVNMRLDKIEELVGLD